MTGDDPLSSASFPIARRILDKDVIPGTAGDPAAAGAALQRTCTRVAENLCDSTGDDGCNALMARAIARVQAAHPAVKSIGRLNEHHVHLDGVAAGIEKYGVAVTTAAIEAFLATLIDLLGRLIGEDMAIRIIDQDGPPPRPTAGRRAP